MTSEEFKNKIAKKHSTKKAGANQLTKAVLDYLNCSGYLAWRNNTVGVFDVNQASGKLSSHPHSHRNTIRKILNSCWRNSHTIKGQPDIIAIQKGTGRMIGVEIKAGKDKLSTDQKRFILMANKAGAMVIECRELADVVKMHEDIGV